MRKTDSFEQVWIKSGLGGDITWRPDSNSLILTNTFHVALINAATGDTIRSLQLSEVYKDVSPYFDGWEDLQMAPDGSALALSSALGVALWDIGDGNIEHLIRDSYEESPTVRWSSDSALLIQPKATQTTIWYVEDLQPVDTIEGQAVDWSPDFSRILLKDGELLRLWDRGSSNSKPIHSLCTATPADWKYIVVCSSQVMSIYDTQTDVLIASFRVEQPTDDLQFAWSSDGAQLAFGNAQSIQILDVDSGDIRALQNPIGIAPPTTNYTQIAWSPQDDAILTWIPGDAGISVWDSISGERLRVLEGALGQIQFVPGEPHLALIEHIYDGLHLWDFTTGETIREISGSSSGEVGWSQDGTMVAVADETMGVDYSVIWDVQTGEALRQVNSKTVPGFEFKPTAFTTASVSPDGNLTVAGRSTLGSATAILGDIDTGEVIATIEKTQSVMGDAGLPVSFGWSPDSRVLVMNYGGDMYLIDSKTGVEIGALPVYVRDFYFSPDSEFIATSGFVVIIWRVPH